MPLPKRPYLASADQVRITRNGDDAIIEYADDSVATAHLKVGAEKLASMTDDELLAFWNDGIEANEVHRQSFSYTAMEIPAGKPQVEFFDRGNQWTPRGHVVRCQILSDAAIPPEVDEPFVSIDGRDFTVGRVHDDGWYIRGLGHEDRVRARRRAAPTSQVEGQRAGRQEGEAVFFAKAQSFVAGSVIRDTCHSASMSAFAPAELEYLRSQRLGRIATADASGQPHVVPVSFRYNAEQDAIEIGGHGGFAKRKKYRDAQQNPRAAFVVDDVVSVQPWNVRGIEIRGAIEIVPMGGSALGPGFDAEMFRLRPKRIVSWGIDGTMMHQNARSVGRTKAGGRGWTQRTPTAST